MPIFTPGHFTCTVSQQHSDFFQQGALSLQESNINLLTTDRRHRWNQYISLFTQIRLWSGYSTKCGSIPGTGKKIFCSAKHNSFPLNGSWRFLPQSWSVNLSTFVHLITTFFCLFSPIRQKHSKGQPLPFKRNVWSLAF